MNSPKPSIQKQLTVQTSPVVVWETLTTKAGLEKFFARNVEIDLREGGTATFALSDTFSYTGTLKNVVPIKKLVWEEQMGEEVTTVEWTLEPEEGGKSTKITMVSSGFMVTNEGVQWGWETVMRTLRWVLEEGFHRGKSSFLGLRGGLIGMGFLISDVLPDSPAARAGIRVGDRIQGIGPDSLCGIGWLADILHKYQPGQPVKVRIVRAGDWIPETVQVTPSGWYLEMGEYDLV